MHRAGTRELCAHKVLLGFKYKILYMYAAIELLQVSTTNLLMCRPATPRARSCGRLPGRVIWTYSPACKPLYTPPSCITLECRMGLQTPQQVHAKSLQPDSS
jgi:hypothetical protein